MSNTDEAPLPPGFSLERTDDLLAIVSRANDPGEAFSLAMMGLVVLGLSLGLGARFGGSTGALIGGGIASPLWAFLMATALGRIVNTTKLLVTKGTVTVVTTPIALKRRRVLDKVTGAVLRMSQHTSSTRGSTKPLVVKTWAVWLTRQGAPDHCAFFELPDEPSARSMCAAVQHALTH